MIKPFQFGRELGADELVDRDQEIAEVVATIEQGGKLFLVGPRRYGKTSILKARTVKIPAPCGGSWTLRSMRGRLS